MNPIFERLGAVPLREEIDFVFDPDINSTLGMELPRPLLELLLEVREPVFFLKGAFFKPLEPCGAEDRRGYTSLSTLFGLGEGPQNLKEENEPLDGFPDNLVAIGDTMGGDLFCLDRDTMEVVRWDHEGDEEDAVTLVAHDFDSFIASLKTEAEVEAES